MITVVALSDLHTGSAFAPFPRRFRLSTGATANLNKAQSYLLKCWGHFCETVPESIDALLLVGDLIHGKNPKESAAELTEVDPEWQQRAALELLGPLAERATKVYSVRGTPYHTGEAARWEEQLSRSLGAIPDDYGRHARPWLQLSIGGIFLDMAHRSSVTIRYGASPLEREIQFMLMRAAAERQPPADLIIRAHIHTHRFLNDDGFLAMTLPSWKIPSSYEETSITPNRKRARLLGGVLLSLWPERKQTKVTNRADFIEHRLIWYNHPRERRVIYDTP